MKKAPLVVVIVVIVGLVLGLLITQNYLPLGSNDRESAERNAAIAQAMIQDLKKSKYTVTQKHWDIFYGKAVSVGCEFIEMEDWLEFGQSVLDDDPFVIYLDEDAKVIWYWYTYNPQGMAVYVVLHYK